MQLTYDELWTAMSDAKALHDKTGDLLVRSAIPLLAKALARSEDPDAPVDLRSQEVAAVEGIAAMNDAWFTLYGAHVR